MAKPQVAAAPRRVVLAARKRSRWRWLGYAGAALATIVLAAVGTVVVLVRASLPDYEGEIAIPALTGPVEVIRDEHAVPHIFAASLPDAYRALGYVHAQDRLFQMEINRRIGAGRLAELIGETGLSADRFMRTVGLYAQAESAVAAMDEEVRAVIEAYAEGVNAWLIGNDGPLPPGVLALRVEPEPWRPADTVVWASLMALRLSNNLGDELLRARLADRLEPAQIADLWPAGPADQAVTLPDLAALYRQLPLDALAAALPDMFARASASNEWAVSGQHTESGRPLLANDPHLGFSAPGLWYLARIVTPELTIAGVTIPGVPLAILGHNERIAWGFTTAHADVQDLFIERLDPADPNRYLTPDGSAPFTTRVEEIHVRGRDMPARLVVRTTRHGPVISDIGGRAAAAVAPGHVLALSFTALLPDDRTSEATYWVNRAQDWREFVDALRRFHAPMQNMVYADVDGTIGFYAPARVPIRRNGDGSAPVPGWTGEFDWVGFVPFAELPQAVNPARGRIVNSNNRIVGDDYRYLIAADWPDGFRARRIEDLLDARPKHSSASFTAIQGDITSTAALQLLSTLVPMARAERRRVAAANASPLIPSALDRLAAWDGAMARSRPEPLIAMTWLRALGTRLYADELGPLADDYGGLRPRVIERILTARTAWCDVTTTPGRESCAAQALAALDDGLRLLSERLGDEIDEWQWGDLHQALFRHELFGRVAVLRTLTDIMLPTDGGPFTINRGFASLRDGDGLFRHVHGPGFRAVYDLSDLDASLFSIATGQSGHPLSRHYDDLSQPWRDGTYLKLAGTAAELRPRALGVLLLIPQ